MLSFLDFKKYLESNQAWLQQAETTGDSKSIASGQNNVEYYKIELKNFMEK